MFEDDVLEGFLNVAGLAFIAIKTLVTFFHVITFVAAEAGCADLVLNTGPGMTAIAFDIFVAVSQWIPSIDVMPEER